MMDMSELARAEISLAGRQQDIFRRALEGGVVYVRDLAAEFGVHEMTIRRDFDALAEQGLLERVRGGARLREQMGGELSQQIRAARHIEAKMAIARAAFTLISPGDTVAFDSSTTALALVRLLQGNEVSAIVSGLDAAALLAANNVPYVMVGGAFHAPARSFTGVLFEDSMAKLHPDKVFFSAKSFHADLGLMDSYLPEVGAKRAILRSGGTIIALMDSTKFGRRALATVALPKEIDVLITNKPLAEPDMKALEQAEVRVIIAA